jgi:hypothetical protein
MGGRAAGNTARRPDRGNRGRVRHGGEPFAERGECVARGSGGSARNTRHEGHRDARSDSADAAIQAGRCGAGASEAREETADDVRDRVCAGVDFRSENFGFVSHLFSISQPRRRRSSSAAARGTLSTVSPPPPVARSHASKTAACTTGIHAEYPPGLKCKPSSRNSSRRGV